jgi:phage repressor protein C with HTH and peptisase S24 domain
MLTHKQVWEGIDRLAAAKKLSASGLAKKAGLDPTTFNRSKRTTKQGKFRWPSTESLAKVLEATGTSMREFVELMHEGTTGPARDQRLRCVRFAQLESGEGIDNAGFLTGGPWEEVEFPLVDDPHAYVLELDSELAAPAYRGGDMLVISPSSSVRRGDRIIARYRDGRIVVGSLVRRTAQRVVLATLGAEPREVAIDTGDLAWIARIVWVSQ